MQKNKIKITKRNEILIGSRAYENVYFLEINLVVNIMQSNFLCGFSTTRICLSRIKNFRQIDDYFTLLYLIEMYIFWWHAIYYLFPIYFNLCDSFLFNIRFIVFVFKQISFFLLIRNWIRLLYFFIGEKNKFRFNVLNNIIQKPVGSLHAK